ncbi:hypothetical protein L873DRAFT_1806183 [Choiromyces venosus 120613-1]|uniref:Uncharacterized protein n=1 Tax=Choiromyces venosus 120613-1 TaxID=1336337 RepID=A0A3N4JN60_9PEZI|nr:hypothetical protein L873DRAFT_1806183 [Choiromyces venosus 120613-1]
MYFAARGSPDFFPTPSTPRSHSAWPTPNTATVQTEPVKIEDSRDAPRIPCPVAKFHIILVCGLRE